MANRVFISGNLGSDIKVTYTAGKGTPVGKFSVGVNEYNSQTKQNETMWVNVTLWGKSAESLSPYLVKGTKVIVTGRLSIRKYKANDGTEKYSTEVVADMVNGVELIGKKKEINEFDKQASNFPDPFERTNEEPVFGEDFPF
ncbi:single-stranded DNA-binding protein [Gemella morbillorum]